MKAAKVPGAVDKIAEWRRAGELLRAELVAARDRLARELEEAENALAELDGRPVALEKHLARPRNTTAVVEAKPMGNFRGGGVQRNGKSGWRWTIQIAGKKTVGKTVKSEAEARAALEEFKRTIGAPPAAHPAPAPAPEPTQAEPKDEAYSPWLPLGTGWGKPDENGLSKHLACNGRGGLNGNKHCEGCKGEGFARCKLRARAA